MALTRGARSGGCHMSGRSGSRTRSLSGEGSSPRVITGHPVLGPVNLSGFALHKLDPLGTRGLFPHHFYPYNSKLFVHCLYSLLKFPEAIKSMLYLFIFWKLSETLRAQTCTNTEVRSALPSAKPSLPRGLLRGEPSNVPKNRQCFFENFPNLSFSYT